MKSFWNAKEHHLEIEEKTPGSSYLARIICDGRIVYETEKKVNSRFELMKIHNDFLKIAEEYEKSGQLPGRADRYLKKIRKQDAFHNN